MNRKFLMIGLVGWLAATLGFRLCGQFILTPDDETRTLVVGLLLSAPLVLLMRTFYRSERLQQTSERLAAAFSVAVPGMLLDALTTLFFGYVFPNMASDAGNDFGALMLWGYAVIIITGLISPGSRKIQNAVYIFALGAAVLILAAPVFAQQKSDKQALRQEQRETRKKAKAYRRVAVYEGGFFGYNRSFGGKVEREFDQLVIRNEKTGAIIFGIDYKSIVAACVESASRPPRWVSLAGDIAPYNVASPLGYVIKAKYHRLFVQYRDPETDVSGNVIFRFERLEAAESLLEQLAQDVGLVKQEPIYVRRRAQNVQTAPAPVEKENSKQP